jgi:hypothetical protein
MESSPVTYRDGKKLFHPVAKKDDEGNIVGVESYREEQLKSINAAKRSSRSLQAGGVRVRCGRPK